MTEPLDIMFDIAGVDLIFDSFTIKGLANYFIDTLYNGEYQVDRQDFRFILQSSDCNKYEINVVDLEFNFKDFETGFRYFFKTTNLPEFDLTGCAEIKAAFQYKEAL